MHIIASLKLYAARIIFTCVQLSKFSLLPSKTLTNSLIALIDRLVSAAFSTAAVNGSSGASWKLVGVELFQLQRQSLDCRLHSGYMLEQSFSSFHHILSAILIACAEKISYQFHIRVHFSNRKTSSAFSPVVAVPFTPRIFFRSVSLGFDAISCHSWRIQSRERSICKIMANDYARCSRLFIQLRFNSLYLYFSYYLGERSPVNSQQICLPSTNPLLTIR